MGVFFVEKTALIIDSTADLTKEMIEKFHIYLMPLRVIYKDREYIDRVNITPNEVYNNLSVEIPHTSLPSIEDIDNLYTQVAKDGYTNAIVICLSSGISGTYGTAKLVAEQHHELNIYVFDSKILSVATGLIVLEVAHMLEDGRSFDEIVSALPEIKSRTHIYYTLATLKYLIKGGRIGKVAGTIGEILNLKPIISVNDDGIYYTYAKARGNKQAVSKFASIALETLNTSKAKIWVAGGGETENSLALYNKLKDNPNVTKIYLGDISPVLGVHTGPGLFGFGILKEV